jgi:hypothetical protein
LNNLRWITKFFNSRKNRQLLRMFGKRRNGRGMLWTSLLGLGASAAAYGFGRSRNNGVRKLAQNLFGDTGEQPLNRVVPMPNKRAAYAEFAEEMHPNQSPPEDESTKSKLD